MQPKRYRIRDGVLRFEDYVSSFEDYLNIPEGVLSIDFNNVQHIKKPLNLFGTLIRELDFKNVITVDTVYLPENCKVKENLYYANKIFLPISSTVDSARLKDINVYDNRTLIYLSGTVVGYLELRKQQTKKLIEAGFAVYDPGNFMTLGDPVADKYPKLVADIDILMMNRAEIIFFDLNNLSAGTCAELGYSIASDWHISKELWYMYKDTKNFFINGLLRYMNRVNTLEEFIQRTYDL